MTPAQHKAAMNAMAKRIDQQAKAAFDDLIERIRRGQAPREAIARIMASFNGDYVAELSERFSAILGEYMGPKKVRSLRVGRVALSTLLYTNAKALSDQVQKIIKDHAAGYHDARALAMTLYKGYHFGPDVLKIEKGLPKYLSDVFARFEASKLKTPALRAAYLQAIEGLESETGMDKLAKQLEIAVYERNRYFANRIAQTELHRAYTDQQARDVLAQPQVVYMQWYLSAAHKITDICDAHAKVDQWGLGPGVYPKAAAPLPPAHPFCLCLLLPRADLSTNPTLAPVLNKAAHSDFLRSLDPDEAARVMGGRAKLNAVLEGKNWEKVINANKDKLYHLKRLGDLAGKAPVITPTPGGGPVAPVMPVVPEPPEFPLPEYREAATTAEAKKIAQAIIDAKGPVDYVDTPAGGYYAGPKYWPGRFRHVGSKDNGLDRFGKVSTYTFQPELANLINETLVEMAEEADKLGIPRMRGITSMGSKDALGSMGDGVLFMDKNLSTGTKIYGYDTVREYLDAGVKNMEALLRDPSKQMNHSYYAQQLARFKEQLTALNSGASESIVMGGSKYTLGGNPSQRPASTAQYFVTDAEKTQKTLWHEFGHHIHQQLGVTKPNEYMHPPMEALLASLKRIYNDGPSQYSMTNHFEWFAESFAMYKAGRLDLVPPPLLELIEHLYATGGQLP